MKPMLAQTFAETADPTGWWMSEKLDGVRAIWDGTSLWSRNGNRFHAPAEFLAALPAGVCLDGELFLGRGKFQTTVGIVRRKNPTAADWSGMTFRVFDAPACPGTFETRLAYCESVLAGNPVAEVVPHVLCTSRDHMEEFFGDIICQGGEGIMLRAAGSAYEQRRSPALLKHKLFESDEAELVGSEPGEGRFAGAIGAIVVRWGKTIFRIGTGLTDDLRACPPPVGSAITFGFCGFTDGGCPRFPTFLAVRSYE